MTQLFSFDPAHPLLFTQFYFWAFFALVFALFSLCHSKPLLRNGYLFAVSLFFYYKTSGVFLALLVFVIVYNFLAAKWLNRLRPERARSVLTGVSVFVDLGILAYFKYAYFITDFVNRLLGLSLEVHDVLGQWLNLLCGASVFRVDAIILPVGISFFTFQAVSYIVDVKRRKIQPVENFLDFGFYLSFFPQLVAGPIVRASEFISQLHKPYSLSRRWFGIAVFWILNGLCKKLILSDYLAVNFCDRVFENPLLYSGFENLSALFCYSLQVYADFSGYTDIATGVAMLMGFWLPKNFDSPYKALNTQQFWRRWHMSLSRWLRDYLYIPLGGNRNASAGTYIIIIAVAVIGSFLSGSWWVAVAVFALAALIGLWAWKRPQDRKLITTNINSMNTMLLGGLWHDYLQVVDRTHPGAESAHCELFHLACGRFCALDARAGVEPVLRVAAHYLGGNGRESRHARPRPGICALAFQCLGHLPDLCVHHLHAPFLPQRLQPGPGPGQ